MLQQWFSKLHL